MVFQKAYQKNGCLFEKNTGKVLVETAGYMPAKTRIENLILAGQRLEAHRKEMYDLNGADDDDAIGVDPTRKGNFDLADAFSIQQSLINKEVQNVQKIDPAPTSPTPNGVVPMGNPESK